MTAGFAAQPNSDQLAIKNYPADHFAISVPSGWIEIPKAELAEIAARFRAVAPKLDPQRFDYGFQFSREAPYPRMLVQVRRTGRMSESLIFSMSRADVLQSEVRHQLNSANPAVAATNLQIGKTGWDAKAGILWSRVQLTNPRGVPMSMLAGMHPTSFGAIQVNCYSTQSDFERFATTFNAMIASVKIDDPFRYHERSMLVLVIETLAAPALIGSVCCVMVVLLIRALRRKAKSVGSQTQAVHRSGAVWKLPVGVAILLSNVSTLLRALGGDGWLQSTDEAQGYWMFWGFLVSLAMFLICWAGRDLWRSRIKTFDRQRGDAEGSIP